MIEFSQILAQVERFREKLAENKNSQSGLQLSIRGLNPDKSGLA
jgi:hypothetical protein